jgi:phosphatidylglycerophosphate synthase
MKITAANTLSLLRVPIGVALVALPRSSASETITARRVLALYLLGLATDLIDGPVARRSSAEPNDQIDSLSDAALILGLLTASSRIHPSRSRAAAEVVLVPSYITSQLIKARLGQSSIRRINQAHFFGSIALISALLAELAHTAGLSARQVAAAESTVLALLAIAKRDRLIAAIRG